MAVGAKYLKLNSVQSSSGDILWNGSQYSKNVQIQLKRLYPNM